MLIHFFLDILPNATIKPKGSENNNVRKKTCSDTSAPSSRNPINLKKYQLPITLNIKKIFAINIHYKAGVVNAPASLIYTFFAMFLC